MGKPLSILSQEKVNYKTIFSKRLSIESAETFHIHYRNLRLEFQKENFEILIKAMKRAYDNYIGDMGIKVPGQVFLDLSFNLKEKKIAKSDELKIELCENLYIPNKEGIFGKGANFYEERAYIHIHYRELRIELPLAEFEIFARSIMQSYNEIAILPNRKPIKLKELFDILNDNELKYIVIRNWDEILDNKLNLDHPDIDFLIDPVDIPKFDYLTNSIRTYLETYRIQRKLIMKIKGKNQAIFVDVRTISDNYFPRNLSEETLNSRKKEKFIFRPDDKFYFLTLLYHMHFHKPQINEGYVEELLKIYNPKWFKFDIEKIRDKDNAADFFLSLNYQIVEPFDKSVYFNP